MSSDRCWLIISIITCLFPIFIALQLITVLNIVKTTPMEKNIKGEKYMVDDDQLQVNIVY
jgi:hypothetical protein